MIYDEVECLIKSAGRALECWTSYQSSVGRADILNEYSVRYGITEYLQIRRIDYSYEFLYPQLSRKRADLKVNIKGKDVFWEFKFVRDTTRDKQEQQRFLADLFRLSLASVGNSYSFFMVMGNRTDYQANFRDIQKPLCKNEYIRPESGKSTNKQGTIYDELFPFVEGECKNFSCQEKRHQLGNMDANEYDKLNGKTMAVEMVFSSDENSLFSVGIWRVKAL